MTPEREYLLVTEFFDGAKEIGEAEVDDGVIDQGLMLIRELWDAGLAHRDIKPANLLVRDGELKLIDVAFVQVRPSPWRQAVDLANMMLVLAVRTDAQRVYEAALRYFTPDEIAEAFAATRGVASPTQLRAAMKSDGRDLMAEFRSMAPARRPISLQRWGIRRVVYVAALLVFVAIAANVIPGMLSPSFETTLTGSPDCGTGNMMVLMAQSVPSATSVPCLATRPAGWQLGGVQIRNDRGRFWLDSDRAGRHARRGEPVASGGLLDRRRDRGAERRRRDAQVRTAAAVAAAAANHPVLHVPGWLHRLRVLLRRRGGAVVHLRRRERGRVPGTR